MTSLRRLSIPFVVACIVIALDQWSKWLIVRHWPDPQTGEITVVPWWLSLIYIRNQGVAFGLFQGVPQLFTVTSTVIVVGLIWFYLNHMPLQDRVIPILIGMIVGGAIGNVIDRVRFNYVVDFIKTLGGNFAIFNVADSAVSVGVVCLAAYLFILERRHSASGPIVRDDGQQRSL